MLGEMNIELGDRAMAAELFEPICTLYDEIFSRPPFHWDDDESEQHRKRLKRLMTSPRFGIAVARTGDGPLVGFAYGFPLQPGTRWWHGMLNPVPDEVTREREGRTFALIDLAVAASYRGHGIGRRLHDLLLGSRLEERATLASEPKATETAALYERWGWHKVGRLKGAPGDSAPFFDIYVRPLETETSP